jgi:DNA-3-methyladenine glycosylase I
VSDALPGPDGRLRCPWALISEEYRQYHDTEWGVPVRTVAGLYERLTLEAFQSGLSWLTILRKREGFRRAFAGFDPVRVSAYGEADVARLLADASIVRNRAKIEAAIGNAAVVVRLGEELVDLVWGAHDPHRPRPRTTAEIPAQTPESKVLAAALRSHGLRFVGPTTMYALLQAVGVVDDHLETCWVPRRE